MKRGGKFKPQGSNSRFHAAGKKTRHYDNQRLWGLKFDHSLDFELWILNFTPLPSPTGQLK